MCHPSGPAKLRSWFLRWWSARQGVTWRGSNNFFLISSLGSTCVSGSVALDAYRPGRSDVDFVAVVDRDLSPPELRRLRLQHARSALHTGAAAIRRRQSPLTGTCNGIFIRAGDLAAPVSEIAPVASHVGDRFRTGTAGSDLSPVARKVLAERGIPIRGPEPSSLPLDPQPDLLRSWNLQNLDGYWRPWASAAQRSPQAKFRARPRYWTAWGSARSAPAAPYHRHRRGGLEGSRRRVGPRRVPTPLAPAHR